MKNYLLQLNKLSKYKNHRFVDIVVRQLFVLFELERNLVIAIRKIVHDFILIKSERYNLFTVLPIYLIVTTKNGRKASIWNFISY